jgi:predicted double-glycine peptidase
VYLSTQSIRDAEERKITMEKTAGRFMHRTLVLKPFTSLFLLTFLLAGPAFGGDLPTAPTRMVIGDVPNLIRVPLVRQSSNYDCGVAALRSVLGYYGEDDIRYENLVKEAGATRKNGTRYQGIVRCARNMGYQAQVLRLMTVSQLETYIDKRTPVILAIQAWVTPPANYEKEWDAGHYVVAVGYDQQNIYFMDPSTTGNYTRIAIDDLMTRWHDENVKGGEKLFQFGIVIDGRQPKFDPDEIKALE